MTRFLLLQNVQLIAAVIVFSNSAKAEYQKNYFNVNKMYCYTELTNEKFNDAVTIAKRVKKHSQGRMYTVIWFDDFVGLAEGFFQRKEIKKLITTLKNFNCVAIFGAHRIKGEVSTLGRQMATNVFMGQTTEQNDVEEMWSMWGKVANNGFKKEEFMDMVNTLPDHNFLHFDRAKNIITQITAPTDMPVYRI